MTEAFSDDNSVKRLPERSDKQGVGECDTRGKRVFSENSGPWRQMLAWSVHLLTASGAVWGFLAMEAAFESAWRVAFLWMLVAVAVDAIDGPLARLFRVKELIPHFDGALLDNIIDYLNYVVVPVVIIRQANFLPEGFSFWVTASILLASAYQFCQASAKTSDCYFTGFPSYWNITVFYLLVLQTNPVWNLAILGLFAVLVFVPIKYIHPSRSKRFRAATMTLTIIWCAMVLTILFQFPKPSPGLIYCSLIYVAYYFGMSLLQAMERSRSNRSD